MDVKTLSLTDITRGLIAKEFSVTELTQAYLKRIKKLDGQVKAFLHVDEQGVLTRAKALDEEITGGQKVEPLYGAPCAVKDVILTKDLPTTAASNILANYVAPYDATVVDRLKQKGMLTLGKVNCDAFAHGASTENSDFGPTHNPWDLDRVPGGSSGGSAAAVAAGLAPYALGTDTGGSIRQPASFCGVVGLKPTYGRASRYGLIAMTSSTDVPSVITRNVEDAAAVLESMAGRDLKDATTLNKEVPSYTGLLSEASLKGVKIGVPKEYFVKSLNKEVEKSVKEAIDELAKQGAEVVEITLPYTEYAVAVYYIITPSEVSANLARFDGIRYGYSVNKDANSTDKAETLYDVYMLSRKQGFGDEAKRRIMIGTHALSSGYYDAYYLKAAKVRTLIRQDFDKAFKKVDLIATPTAPHAAFKIGEQSDDPLKMYLEDIFVISASLAGLPAISIPCGFAKPAGGSQNLPVGLQLMAPQFKEDTLLQAAYLYEQSTEWHNQCPNI